MRSTVAPETPAGWLAALGEPTRLAVVRALAAGQRTVTELARACGVEVVNVSHHLGAMRAAGVVTAERDGRLRRYRLVGATAVAGGIEVAHPSGLKVFVPLA